MATINLTIPDDKVNEILEAFNWATNQHTLQFNGSFRPNAFVIDKQDTETENNLQFGKRVIRELVINLVKTYQLDADYTRYKNELKAITQPTENVENTIIE